MSIHIIGEGYVEIKGIPQNIPRDVAVQAIRQIVKQTYGIKEVEHIPYANGTYLNVRLDGNNHIDYEALDKIKLYLDNIKAEYEIAISEYDEKEGGGYVATSKDKKGN